MRGEDRDRYGQSSPDKINKDIDVSFSCQSQVDSNIISGVPKDVSLSQKNVPMSDKEPRMWIQQEDFYGTLKRLMGHPISASLSAIKFCPSFPYVSRVASSDEG